jgi:hypothetical protein
LIWLLKNAEFGYDKKNNMKYLAPKVSFAFCNKAATSDENPEDRGSWEGAVVVIQVGWLWGNQLGSRELCNVWRGCGLHGRSFSHEGVIGRVPVLDD